jgi:hypothetical protein
VLLRMREISVHYKQPSFRFLRSFYWLTLLSYNYFMYFVSPCLSWQMKYHF